MLNLLNRRGFLGRLLSGTAALAVTPSLLSEPFMSTFVDEIPLDPMAGWVSHKFHMTTTLSPNASQRLRYISSSSSSIPVFRKEDGYHAKGYKTYVFADQ